ncbi:hypothetical protein AVEN_206287-1 [Araneus ventricosus]|uniref:RNase H type-1 domain-containing protein n=1 Tax=Araneus ventricosus TaxID=182803 RepID=A0A4Y2V3C1_ARAVE|nr:hypothetical protein AVEN_112800-1 [Araneus ventricosus]GBO18546.1 hypothetical protein AVEN_206287-1 [Araneus ventricosus]
MALNVLLPLHLLVFLLILLSFQLQIVVDYSTHVLLVALHLFCSTPWNSHGLNFLNPFKTFDKANTAPEIYQQLFADHREVYQNFIPIFTDGSKCSSCTSFACVIINSTLSFQLHPSCSIFTAEITAILHALSQISSGPPDNYIIYSDSFSALESMTSLHRFRHPLTFNILELHDRLACRGFSVLLCWVPSHVGISGNEHADNLAKSATDSIKCPVPLSDIKKCQN